MTTIATRRIKPDTRAVLAAAYQFHLGSGAWFRPKDVGGSASSHCADHLKGLIGRGLVERQDAAPGSWRERKLWEYRITAAGVDEVRTEPRKTDLMAALVTSLAGKDVGSGGDLSSVRSLSGSEVTVPQSRRPIGPTGREDSPRVAPAVNWCVPDCAACDGVAAP